MSSMQDVKTAGTLEITAVLTKIKQDTPPCINLMVDQQQDNVIGMTLITDDLIPPSAYMVNTG